MRNKNIKMRINHNKDSVCDLCDSKWKNVPEMYDIMLKDQIFTVCKQCTSELFHKILKADCLYSGKTKSNEDLQRLKNYEEITGHSIYVSGYQVK